MTGLRSLLIFFFSVFFSQAAFSTSITAIQDGNWANTDTWGGAGPPGCFDSIIIPAGMDVTITNTVNLTGCPPIQVFVSGNLIFQNGKKLDLPNGSVVWVYPGGEIDVGSGGGSSTYITIDGDQYWNAADGPLTGPGVLCQNCALPIELVSFTAELASGIVYVNWQTASESGNDYFWVQRSTDGINWTNLTWVDGAGNSTELLSYSAEDRAPLLGISYYRLMQVDENGQSSYSETRVISNAYFFSDQQLLVISNASATQQNVVVYFSEVIDAPAEVIIVSVSGATLYSETRVLNNEKWLVITLDRPVAGGIYVVKSNHLLEKVFFQ